MCYFWIRAVKEVIGVVLLPLPDCMYQIVEF